MCEVRNNLDSPGEVGKSWRGYHDDYELEGCQSVQRSSEVWVQVREHTFDSQLKMVDTALAWIRVRRFVSSAGSSQVIPTE